MSDVTIVNAVGSGSIGVELNLERLSADIAEVDYDPEKYPGAYVRFDDGGPLVTLYRTGKFIVTGADSEAEADSRRQDLLQLLSSIGVLESAEDEWFSMQNYVCTAEIGESLNLNALTIALGLERTEYEPEQFPGLIYRPEDANVVLLAFGSGEVVITGAKSVPEAERGFQDLKAKIQQLL